MYKIECDTERLISVFYFSFKLMTVSSKLSEQ